MKYTTLESPNNSSNNNITSSSFNTTMTGNSGNVASALFCEQVCTVTNLFEKWNDCERTVVMYALLKRLRYPSLKFLQYSIDNTLTQNMGSESNLSNVVLDINANNPSYLQNLLNSYKTFHMGDVVDTLSSSSSDKDSMPCYGSDFQITQCDERRLYGKKEDILHEVLHMLPLLKPTNVEAKLIYLALIPIAVKDTMHQIVPTDLVQQIFSYLLIHPSISSEDRRSLNVWLRHLEDHIQSPSSSSSSSNSNISQQHNNSNNNNSFFLQPQSTNSNGSNLKIEKTAMTTSSGSSASSSSSVSCSSASNISIASSLGNLAITNSISSASIRNADWQTIAPPSKANQQLQAKATTATTTLPDWSSLLMKRSSLTGGRGSIGGGNVGGVGVDTLCDNLNGITLNELGSSQKSLRLSLSGALLDATTHAESSSSSSLVSGVVAGVSVTAEVAAIPTTTTSLFGSNTNPIISIMSHNNSNNSSSTNHNNNSNNCSNNNNNDNDTSFSKNGTEIMDFDPNSNLNLCGGDNNINMGSGSGCQSFQHIDYASILLRNTEQMDTMNRWSLDSKLTALKTRRSNSLTTQTISSSGSSSNSSVITVNDNCSNSTENLAQFANKPRSYSLSIEHPRAGLTNSGSDTRLDEFKPNYIKFQTRSVGMSCIGLWLKSLRLHKYIDLFKNMTYEEMLQITEEYLQNLGVTKGASHKLALCIEKLKERAHMLAKMENDLLSGQLKVQSAVEDLANMVLTPMKPVESVTTGTCEENVALRFLNALDLVCSLVHKEHYCAQDEENISVIMWILDRSIHNEAFLNHANQLKDLKFRLSKLKMAMAPKMHHIKNGSGGNLNKPRWNGKNRKCEPKNGSNDRINHRKNSNDMLNFSLSCLQQQQQQQQQLLNNNSNNNNNNNNNNTSNNNNNINNNQPHGDYEKYYHNNYNNNNNNNGQPYQYKSSSYPSFVKQQLEVKQILDQMPPQTPQQYSYPTKQQQQQQQQQLSQQQHQHRRSLNNLIVVSGGAQQPQKMIFKLGQGVLSSTASTTTTATAATAAIISSSVEALKIENALLQQHQQMMQQRKASLTIGLNNNAINSNNLTATNPDITIQQQQSSQQQQQQTQQKPKNPMASIVMVSSDDIANNIVVANNNQQQQQPQILINNNNNNNNNNSNMLNNNLLCQQQQQQQQREHQNQQLQLLAAAAAAVGNMNCICNNSCNNSSNSNSNTNNNSNNSSKSNCSNCNCCLSSSSSVATTAAAYDPTPLIASINLPLKEKYHQQQHQQQQHNQHSHHHHNSQHHHHHQVTNAAAAMNDIKSLEQLETLCLQMTEQAIN